MIHICYEFSYGIGYSSRKIWIMLFFDSNALFNLLYLTNREASKILFPMLLFHHPVDLNIYGIVRFDFFFVFNFSDLKLLFSFFLQHSILKPFMLRRVKTDVISELTRKTEVTVHCKLSSRQQAFYQAIKNKISLAELFDNNRGHLNEKKILNLMNIVIQLRKVCYLFHCNFLSATGRIIHTL